MSLAPDQCRGCERTLTADDATPVVGMNGVLYCGDSCRSDHGVREAAAVAICGGIQQ